MQEEQIHGNIEYDSCRAWQKNKTKEISVAEAVTVLWSVCVLSRGNPFLCDSRKEAAMKRAEEVQRQIDDGTLAGPLAGVPAAVKDNICTEGTLTTCSSRILSNFVPPYSAEAVKNLEKQER